VTFLLSGLGMAASLSLLSDLLAIVLKAVRRTPSKVGRLDA